MSLQEALKSTFGLDSFRAGQKEAIESVMSGRDTLLVMPTGGGKSLCFQLPATLLDGITIVVSPLIALMADQVAALEARGIGCALLNSSLTAKQYAANEAALASGEAKLLYVAPERFANQGFLDLVRELDVSLFVVDEAHCHPAGTRVLTTTGSMAIEDFRVPGGGEKWVLTTAGAQPVLGVGSRKVSVNDLVVVSMSDGTEVEVTKDHPVFLSGVGYVPSAFLEKGDVCYAVDSVSDLREGVSPQSEGEGQKTVSLLFSGLLADFCEVGYRDSDLSYLLEGLRSEGFLDSNLLLGTVWASKGSRCCVGSHDPRQSNEAARRAAEGIQSLGRKGFDRTRIPRGKRAGNARTTENGWTVVSFPCAGVPSGDWQDEGWTSLRSKGGRSLTQGNESAGGRPTERTGVSPARLVAVESVQPISSRLDGATEVEVFSLEVGGPHNYFANGILVHNCISQWGHDFRPDYRRLFQARKRLGELPVLAVTATATPDVRKDIVAQLAMDKPFVHVSGFDRPNLTFCGKRFDGPKEKDIAFKSYIRKMFSSSSEKDVFDTAIIYCGTKKHCESVAYDVNKTAEARGLGKVCSVYHAGMSDKDRTKAQKEWLGGKVPWVAATISFGMGIDKSDVRYVLHYTIPGTLEAYYQEVGRAGRDGEPSKCNLFYTAKDIILRKSFIQGSNPPQHVFQAVYDALSELLEPGRMTKIRYSDVSDYLVGYRLRGNPYVANLQVSTCLTLMKREGVFHSPRRGYMVRQKRIPHFHELSFDYKAIGEREARDVSRLQVMEQFVKSGDKRKFILDYFGEKK